MKPLINLTCILLFFIVAGATTYSQDDPKDKNSAEFFLRGSGKLLELSFSKSPPSEFISNYSSAPGTYRLFEVEAPDPEKECTYAKCILELKDFLDTNAPPRCTNETDCQKVVLQLKNDLTTGKNFVLVVSGLTPNGKLTKVPISIEPKAAIVAPFDAYKQRKQFRVVAKFPLTSASTVIASRTIYKITGNTPATLRAEEVTKDLKADVKTPETGENGTLSYHLEEKLPEGAEYTLTVKDGIKDNNGNAVEAKGVLKTPGTPAAPDAPKLTGSLALNTATGQKGILDVTGTFAPLRTPVFGTFYWEPSLAIDLGLRSTKSNNSVTLLSPFTRNFDLAKPKHLPLNQPQLQPPGTGLQQTSNQPTNIKRYADWKNTPWYYPADIKFYVGPKAEFDRNFKRKNLLGNVRFDFNFWRWLATIANQCALITDADGGIGEEKGKSLEGIDFGFKLVPYVSFDAGGHVNNETVHNDAGVSVFVPRHAIFRTYFGFNGVFEGRLFDRPVSLTLDESAGYLAKEEQIGYVDANNNNGVFLRRVRGIQPHFKTSFDISFDPAKHYSLTLEYENGRQAPNFVYLNKFTTGIKVTY